MQWLSYTYLYVRMMQNPLPYGITWADLSADPRLEARRCPLQLLCATQLRRHAACAPDPGSCFHSLLTNIGVTCRNGDLIFTLCDDRRGD